MYGRTLEDRSFYRKKLDHKILEQRTSERRKLAHRIL